MEEGQAQARETERVQKKQCPKCGVDIPDAATVCPVCQSDIRDRTKKEKRRESFIKIATFVKDWIGFPAAALAAILALYIPAEKGVLSIIHQDGANLKMVFLDSQFINVGTDDRPLSAQVDEIFVTIPFQKSTIVNSGFSAASIRPDFRCTTLSGENKVTGHFYFIDLATQKRILNDINLGSSDSTFLDVVLQDQGNENEGYSPTMTPDTCELRYLDKYGLQTLVVELSKQESRSPLLLGGLEDRRVSIRQKYCDNMIKGISIADDDPIDCVSDTHVIAIEPVYLWESALRRALRQTSAFRQSTQSVRVPGLVLENCTDAPNCAESATAMTNALANFTPSITVWLCDPVDEKLVDLKKCQRTEFPRPKP